MADMKALLPHDDVQRMIHIIRGQKVMFDEDLARLYAVPTKRLNEQVHRNKKRFPPDFMFELTLREVEDLRSQIATSSWGGRRYRPNAFTEQGVAMLSTVLNSERAIQVNIMIMRAFVGMRQMMSLNRALAKRLASIERRLTGHNEDIRQIYRIIQEWSPFPDRRRIGLRED
jgi:hypothetical protein